MTLLSGCGGGAAGTSNKFVSATLAEKYIEASGYLGGDYSGGEGEDSSNTSALLPESAKPDFKVSEQSDTTAKVVSASDGRDYMLLSKDKNNWLITEVCYFEDFEVTEPVSYETNSTDDPSAWEGDDGTTTEGQDGEATYKVTTKLLNGQSSELDKKQIAMNKEPVTAEVTRGTKPRSAGWRTFDVSMDNDPVESVMIRITGVRRDGKRLIIESETMNADEEARRWQPEAVPLFALGSKKVVLAAGGPPYAANDGPFLGDGPFLRNADESGAEFGGGSWSEGNPYSQTFCIDMENGSEVAMGKVQVVLGNWPSGYVGKQYVVPLSELYPGPVQ